METRWDTVDVGGDPMGVYVAIPDGPGPFGAVIINHGLGSAEEVIQTHTRRVAEAGFVGAAPLYYHRQKDDILEQVKDLQPGTPERSQLLRQKMQQLHDSEVIADGEAVFAHLQGLPSVAPNRIGVLGFCMGGRITYLETTALPGLRASVPFYPSALWSAWGDGATAFDRSANIPCPVLALFGAEDRVVPPGEMRKLDAELSRLGKTHEFHTYEGAGHDFQNFNSVNYNEKAAKESWPVAMAFLGKHLR